MYNFTSYSFFKNSESAQFFCKVNNVTMVHKKIIRILIAIVSKRFFFGFCEFERHSLFFYNSEKNIHVMDTPF